MNDTTKIIGSYTDGAGTEAIVIENDGRLLTTEIRGVAFSGDDFDFLRPVPGESPEKLKKFTLLEDEVLCNCIITADIPVSAVKGEDLAEGIIEMTLDLGPPRQERHRGISHENLFLKLKFGDSVIASSGQSGFFENELNEIGRQLPQDTFIKSCINCQYSDYSIYGNGLFGDMLCFRNIKDLYMEVAHQKEFSKLIHLEVERKCSRNVQETYLCPEFQRRVAGTGYRG